jgi:uncharacterized membrane protein
MSEWTLQPVAGPLVMIALTIALFALFLLRPQFQSATTGRRWILRAIRFVATLMLLVALLRPGCVRTIEKQQSAVLLLMCDVSRSMQLPHRSDEESRWEAIRRTVTEQSTLLKDLGEQNIQIKVVGFDGKTYPIEFMEGDVAFPAVADGGSTDIGSSLEESLAALRSQRLIAAIIMSDGVQNNPNPRVELPQAVNELVQLQTPLYTIPFGQEGNEGQFADVAVENMADQFSVFVKNRLLVKATIKSRGFVNQEIPVNLILENAKGEREIVYTQNITIPEDGFQQLVEIPFIPQEPGQFKLLLQVEEQPAELVTRNNRLPAFLTVYDGGLRVLYVFGSLTAEQRYLKTSIAASPDIDVDFFLISPRTRRGWPLDRPDLFDPSRYDVFIFADVDSRALYEEKKREENFAELIKAIDQGKGFMMIGGSHSFGPGLYHSTPLADVLPVEMDTFERQDFDTPLIKAFHLAGPLEIKATENHFLTSFTDNQGNSIWPLLPPLPGANRIRAKRSSRVLLETAAGDPIMVVDNSGGRVLAMAADSTWMWYTHDQQDFHQRFWRQVILWLAGRDGLQEGNVWIELSQRRFTQDVPVSFTAGARDGTGKPIVNADFQLTLQLPDGSTRSLVSTRKTGVLDGTVDPELLSLPGSYQLRLVASKESMTIGQTAAEFILFDQDKEKSNPVANPGLLTRIANQTRAAGGRSLPPEEFGKLLDEIKSRPLELKIEVPESWKLGDTVADGMAFMLLFVTILVVEWFLRKKWGMV